MFPFALFAACTGGGKRAETIVDGPMTFEFSTSARIGMLPLAIAAEKKTDL